MQPDTTWEIPHPQALTLAELDDILATTGVDVQNSAANRPSRILAAIVVWSQARQGTVLDIDEVYKTLTLGQIRFSTVDPTMPVASTG